MSKMGLHDPFGFLKHELWPKEGPEVKLPIWLPTIKSQEPPWFIYVKVVCHIPLKSSWQELQLFFRLHLDQSSSKEVMGLQSRGSPNFENFETPTWESLDKHLGAGLVATHREYYKGEGDGFPQVWAVVSLVSLCLLVACPCTKSVRTMR
jgi:hypothetical protein